MRLYLIAALLIIILLPACAEKEVSQEDAPEKTAKKPSEPVSVQIRMPKQMRHCTPCHPLKKGERHKIGPNLYGVVGREVGTAPGYRYSREYKEGKWKWTRENIDLLINKKYGTLEEAVRKLTGNPKARTKMKFYGANDEDAQIILDYLETLKDRPQSQEPNDNNLQAPDNKT